METKSEELHARVYDNFVSNAVIKTGYGAGIGLLFSLLVFKRRPFPIYFGSGIGLGFSLSDFNKHLKSIK